MGSSQSPAAPGVPPRPAHAAPGKSGATPPVTTYAAPSASDYYRYKKPPTTGKITPLINRRDSGGPGGDHDSTEPLDGMQIAVQALGAGDYVDLSSWLFDPETPLTAGSYASTTNWGDFLAAKAGQGVVVRILINDFDPIDGGDNAFEYNECIAPLNALIGALPAAARDNLKYIVT